MKNRVIYFCIYCCLHFCGFASLRARGNAGEQLFTSLGIGTSFFPIDNDNFYLSGDYCLSLDYAYQAGHAISLEVNLYNELDSGAMFSNSVNLFWTHFLFGQSFYSRIETETIQLNNHHSALFLAVGGSFAPHIGIVFSGDIAHPTPVSDYYGIAAQLGYIKPLGPLRWTSKVGLIMDIWGDQSQIFSFKTTLGYPILY